MHKKRTEREHLYKVLSRSVQLGGSGHPLLNDTNEIIVHILDLISICDLDNHRNGVSVSRRLVFIDILSPIHQVPAAD